MKIKKVSKEEITKIIYSISAVYSNSRLTFYSDGRIEYEGRASQTKHSGKEKNSGKISRKQFQELAKLIEESGFFSWDKGYFEPSLCDGETISISVFKGDKEKRVSCYGISPEGFDEIVSKIKQLWPKPMLQVGV